MVPISNPSTVIATLLSGDPGANVDPASNPNNMSEHISAGPN